MNSRKASITRGAVLMFFVIWAIAPVSMRPTLAAPQTVQCCVEDFTSDTDPTTAGLASCGFSHSLSGNTSFIGSAPNHQLALFAGGMDVITFPGQTVTYAKVSFNAFSPGFIIFEGAGDTLTTRFNPGVAQFREASNTSLGDNGQPLGQILEVTLITSETFFDTIEISPCTSVPPPSATVDVLVRPEAINPNRNDGVMKAVILSDAGFDATTVDPTTVQFGAATVPFRYFFGDEDEDGDTDLIFFFLVGEVDIQCGDTTIRLTGRTTSGQQIEGEGPIRTVGC